ncbi:MAG: BlaI/MecI/CopY family transcriptional regulator [Oscillibacter sp.]|nr:BlaI/MecI/CopY family transcriptional regulator [Oscillibacter sp.]
MISHLSDAELEIMKIIWPETRKPIRFAWILEELSARGKAWQPNTLITLLGRLTNKGFLSVTKVGRKNEYTPLISEADYQSAQTQTFLHKVYRGDAKGLVMALIQRDLLSAGDYEDLRRFWEQEEK